MDNRKILLKYAIYYLSKYSSSKQNLEYILKKKIRRIAEDKKIRFELYKEIIKIISNLENQNLINDAYFTDSKIHLLISQGKSKNFIKQYLLKKGVNTNLIDTQISLIYETNKNIEKENAMKFAKKKNLLNNFNDNLEYTKNLSKMARAGFSYEIAKEILK